MDNAQVVGWLLHRESLCENCRANTAVVILTYDGVESSEVCGACIPDESDDLVAEVFKRAWEGDQGV